MKKAAACAGAHARQVNSLSRPRLAIDQLNTSSTSRLPFYSCPFIAMLHGSR